MKLIKFGAEWCAPCRQQRIELKKLREMFNKEDISDIEIDEVDVEENEELAKEFEVRSVPVSFLFDDNDRILHKFVGLFPANNILKTIKSYRDERL